MFNLLLVGYLETNRLPPLLAQLFYELKNAVKNGKELNLGDEEKYAYFCLTDKTPVITAWMELFRGQSKVHISLEQVTNKPEHYKAIFRGDIPADGKSQEYYQMFQEGGELKIVKENDEGLIIESNKLNMTYIFSEGEQGCDLMKC